VEKYCRVEQATDDNTVYAHTMLDAYGYRHTLSICNTYCLPLQQWLHSRTLMLCYTPIACLVILFMYLSIYVFLSSVGLFSGAVLALARVD